MKKKLAEQQAAAEALQKEIVVLKAGIQLREAADADKQKVDSEYSAAKARFDADLKALNDFETAERAAVDAAVGANVPALETKIKEFDVALKKEREAVAALKTTATDADAAATKAAAAEKAAGEVYDAAKQQVQYFEQQIKAARTLKESIEKAKTAKDTPRVFLLVRRLKDALASAQVPAPEAVAKAVSDALTAKEKAIADARAARQTAADAGAKAEAGDKAYQARVKSSLDDLVKTLGS
jgi:hypothetical protein